MVTLLKPAFAAQIQCSKVGALHNSHMLRVFHTMGLVADTIGLAALLEDGLVLEFLVIGGPLCSPLVKKP
jgi:hypothetical protein